MNKCADVQIKYPRCCLLRLFSINRDWFLYMIDVCRCCLLNLRSGWHWLLIYYQSPGGYCPSERSRRPASGNSLSGFSCEFPSSLPINRHRLLWMTDVSRCCLLRLRSGWQTALSWLLQLFSISKQTLSVWAESKTGRRVSKIPLLPLPNFPLFRESLSRNSKPLALFAILLRFAWTLKP